MVNPGKLKALVDTHSENPGMAAISNPSDAAGDDDFDDEEDSEAGEEEAAPAADPLTRGNELIGQWGLLGAHLKEEAGEIVDEAHEVGSDLLLAKVPEETITEVEDLFDKMPEEIQHCLAKYVAKLPPDDVTALATALVDGHDGDTEDADVKLMAVFLTTISAHAAEEVDPDDIADEEPEEDEDEDKDEEEDTEEDAAPPADEQAPPE